MDQGLQAVGCDTPDSQRTDEPAARRATATTRDIVRDLRIVEYFIEGTADYFIEGTADSVDITMTNAQGNTEQATGIAVPMTAGGEEGLSLGHVESGTFVYLSAQNRGRSGTVTCRITINGSTVSTATSKGAYVIAVCDAVVP